MAISPARAALGFIDERAAGRPIGLLLQVAEMERRVLDGRSAVGFFLAGEDF